MQATEAVKPVSPNYAFGNGVGKGVKKLKLLPIHLSIFQIKDFPMITGREAEELRLMVCDVNSEKG